VRWDWIQCPVTARNCALLGAVQTSVVNEIFPTDFYKDVNISSDDSLLRMYLHFLPKLHKKVTIDLVNLIANGLAARDISLFEILAKEQKNLLQMW
jgi:hypothetical protein